MKGAFLRQQGEETDRSRRLLDRFRIFTSGWHQSAGVERYGSITTQNIPCMTQFRPCGGLSENLTFV
jgi:hypothetical protein